MQFIGQTIKGRNKTTKKYISSDVLVYGIAEYFCELCLILTSP